LLADARAIRKTLLSASARKRLKGKTVIQMGTIGPSESRQLAKAVQKAGGNYLEAPVLGSVAEARSGTLHVMAGGTREPFERWLPVLKDLGEEPVLVGTTGKAAAFKLGLNQLIASLTASFGLSLAFIQSQGVEVGAFMKVLRKSALYALAYDKKLPRMLEHDYKNPNFPTRHLVKDIDLFLREARGGKLDTAALQGVRKIVSKAIGKGYGAKDYSALFEAIRR
jgi:3-hydroxyisobutyrate dehydrogenase